MCPGTGGHEATGATSIRFPHGVIVSTGLTISLSQSNFSSRELLQVRTGDDGSSKEYRDLADCQHSVLRYELQVSKECIYMILLNAIKVHLQDFRTSF